MNTITKEELDRFNKFWKVERQCHIWTNYLDRDGYGSFYFRKKLRRAHRVSYFMHVGEIPEGMTIDHVCGNPSCVNPGHLRILTRKENNLDSRNVGAINARKTHCKNGHPFDRFYCNQRSCSICTKITQNRLKKKWREEGKAIKC